MRHILILIMTVLYIFFNNYDNKKFPDRIRFMIDTVGFAHQAHQMDSVMKQISTLFADDLIRKKTAAGISACTHWKIAISPHDDYAYASYLYPLVLDNVKANTVILFGVAHKATLFGLKDRIIFDSYTAWNAPYGPIPASSLRDEIIAELPPEYFVVHDSMQTVEHSIEALLPFLQYNNHEIEIISILIPYMTFDRMKTISQALAQIINKAVKKRGWTWGNDFAFLTSTDAVHYGDEGWGDKNFAYYGTDSTGYNKAIEYEHKIISTCLTGSLETDKIHQFCRFTVQENDYTQYKWSWCGRYSVPFGLLTGYFMQDLTHLNLQGALLGYATSIDHEHLSVKHFNMGTTAPAYMRHWVGYAAIGYQ